MIRTNAAMPIRAGGSYGVSLPQPTTRPTATPATAVPAMVRPAAAQPAVTLPGAANQALRSKDPRKGLELMDALTHPIRVIKGAWQWGTSLFKFDRLGPISTANATPAQDKLAAARAGLDKIGLARLLPFLSNAIEKRAAEALTELRPDVERQLSAKAGHGIHIVWPAGVWSKAFDELVLFDRTFQEAEPAAVMKALSGVSEINVQKLSVVDWFKPIRKEAATLFIQRPIEWAPGQKPMEEVLKGYFTQVSSVSAMI